MMMQVPLPNPCLVGKSRQDNLFIRGVMGHICQTVCPWDSIFILYNIYVFMITNKYILLMV